jgi:hypothetical protein
MASGPDPAPTGRLDNIDMSALTLATYSKGFSSLLHVIGAHPRCPVPAADGGTVTQMSAVNNAFQDRRQYGDRRYICSSVHDV